MDSLVTNDHQGPYKTAQIAARRRQLRSTSVDDAAVQVTATSWGVVYCGVPYDVLIEKLKKFTICEDYCGCRSRRVPQ